MKKQLIEFMRFIVAMGQYVEKVLSKIVVCTAFMLTCQSMLTVENIFHFELGMFCKKGRILKHLYSKLEFILNVSVKTSIFYANMT